MDKATCF